jgi:hypothetical protein
MCHAPFLGASAWPIRSFWLFAQKAQPAALFARFFFKGLKAKSADLDGDNRAVVIRFVIDCQVDQVLSKGMNILDPLGLFGELLVFDDRPNTVAA